jgi:hypothetical protein
MSGKLKSTNENLVHKVDVMNGMSDHQMIITTINARPKIIRNKPRKVYLYKKGNLFHLDVMVFDGMYWSIALKRCDLKVVQYPSMFISLYFSLKLSSLLSRYSKEYFRSSSNYQRKSRT